MIRPITPAEMPKKSDRIPDEVISAVNTLILKEWDGDEAHIFQDDIIRESLINFEGAGIKMTRDDLFDRKYLDIEECFSKVGWAVKYESPERGESFKSYFVFRKPSLNDEHGA